MAMKINISMGLLLELYKHYYNEANFFRDMDGHELWNKLKEESPEFSEATEPKEVIYEPIY